MSRGTGKRKPISQAAFILVFRIPGSIKIMESFADKFFEEGCRNDFLKLHVLYSTVLNYLYRSIHKRGISLQGNQNI
jgi:hypothetical protein